MAISRMDLTASAKKARRLPVVLTQCEVRKLLQQLQGAVAGSCTAVRGGVFRVLGPFAVGRKGPG